MAGLKNVRDLGLDAYMATPVEVVPVNVSPVVITSTPVPVVVDAVNTDSVNEVKETVTAVSPSPNPRAKKSKAKLTPAPSWQQTGLSITKSTMLKLRLESVVTGKTMSEIAEALLSKYLPNNRVAS